MTDALADPSVRTALKELEGDAEKRGADLAGIGAIRSPSGSEHLRAAAVADRMRAIGLSDVTVDSTPNAIGRIPGRSGRALLFVSTLDDLATVAEYQSRAARPPRVEGDRVLGPRTNTEATTIALLSAAEAYLKAGLKPEHDQLFAAVAQEETGLTGLKKLYAEYRDRAIGFVDILGDGGSISSGALGIHFSGRFFPDPPTEHVM